MDTTKRAVAAIELLLVFPAALFITALVMRSLQPTQFEPARTAQRIVDWYTAWSHAELSVLLIALPLVALISGSVALARSWRKDAELRRAVRQTLQAIRAHLAMLLVAVATLAAAGILAIVVGHLITD